MAYRSDVEALEARLADLQRDLADRTRERDEVARLIAESRDREPRAAILADLAAGGPTRRLQQRALITLGFIVVAVLGVLGYRALHRDDRNDRIMAEFAELTDMMCLCKDKACADAVMAKVTTWGAEVAKEISEPPKLDEAMTKRASELGTRLGECAAKAMSLP